MTRKNILDTLFAVRNSCETKGLVQEVIHLDAILDAFKKMESTAASIMGSKGGNTPVKPGSRPRGRPRKDIVI